MWWPVSLTSIDPNNFPGPFDPRVGARAYFTVHVVGAQRDLSWIEIRHGENVSLRHRGPHVAKSPEAFAAEDPASLASVRLVVSTAKFTSAEQARSALHRVHEDAVPKAWGIAAERGASIVALDAGSTIEWMVLAHPSDGALIESDPSMVTRVCATTTINPGRIASAQDARQLIHHVVERVLGTMCSAGAWPPHEFSEFIHD